MKAAWLRSSSRFVAYVAHQGRVDPPQSGIVEGIVDGQLAVLLPEVVLDELGGSQKLQHGDIAFRHGIEVDPSERLTEPPQRRLASSGGGRQRCGA